MTSERYSASEWTQQNMLNDLMQQKWLLLGAGCVIGALWLFSRRSSRGDEEKAARRLVRNMRKVDDADDVRGLLGENLPVILRPALLLALDQFEDIVHGWFDRLEHELERL